MEWRQYTNTCLPSSHPNLPGTPVNGTHINRKRRFPLCPNFRFHLLFIFAVGWDYILWSLVLQIILSCASSNDLSWHGSQCRHWSSFSPVSHIFQGICIEA